MKILALDTSTEACSAALLLDDQVVERYQIAPREHNRLILPMIEGLLAEAGLVLTDLDALAFGRGPGSFTGVRIATGVVQGLSFGADLPVAPVSTLAALAQDAFDTTDDRYTYACIDARMGEVYWGVYQRDEDGLAELLGEEVVIPADAVTIPNFALGVGAGSGWGTYGENLRHRLGTARITGVLEARFPRASCIARLATRVYEQQQCVSAENAQPVYLRDRVAKKPGGGW